MKVKKYQVLWLMILLTTVGSMVNETILQISFFGWIAYAVITAFQEQ